METKVNQQNLYKDMSKLDNKVNTAAVAPGAQPIDSKSTEELTSQNIKEILSKEAQVSKKFLLYFDW